MPKIKVWISAARLRTLPLSLSGIIVGTALGSMYNQFRWDIFVFALLTTVGFQVTSNFANDYGDGVKGTDNETRVGPKRALQSGQLSRKELKVGIIISIIICILFTVALLYLSFGTENLILTLIFGALGILSIWAAIKYTVGSSAYGYKGLGDLFVFLFFGLLGVMGSMFLYTKALNAMAIFPAVTIGLLSTGVLNLNNLRDYESDKTSNKNTLIVKMGIRNGKIYHVFLIAISFISILAFTFIHYHNWKNTIHLVAFVPIFIHLNKMWKIKNTVLLDPELKKLALSTFLLSILFYFSFNNFS
ncbi:1,4-dihydroxy-2-naphthoate octaprenyltransferase [Arenibacter palladensis]|uniref:1,4-dihydroxy-2-naphthoate octaprenyltransferase n=1 Tax=Arenibacter palladensis TaxID=237373 RepID=UPI0026E225C5|nr:1,4-dihydroxy-2-naphthoate octaprenyltransferase [Arenibacter palladensis]MDO6601996.1 1,4-dihydroxy-2-naphthoate octaprenyltransferase [Arenibacter palladensis]